MTNKHSKAPNWKLNAIHGAIALMVANTVFVPNALAVGGPSAVCGSTISANQGACYALDASAVTINSGVKVSSTTGAALVYPYIYSSYSASNAGNLAGSLTNKGTISSISDGSYSAVGVYIENELTGTLTNSGTISAINSNTSGYARAYGIVEGGGSDLSGTLTNTGTISVNAIGNGAEAYGIYVGNNMAGTIKNSGTISVSAFDTDVGDAHAYGIYVGGTLTGSLINSGTINVAATSLGSDAFNATGIYISGDLGVSAVLNNSGTITAVATAYSYASDARGIYVGGDVAGLLINSGTISATAISTNGGYATAYGILVDGSLSGTLTNSGTISASATNLNRRSAQAVGVYVNDSLVGSTLTNSGTISATANAESGYAQAYGIALGTLAGTLTNTGTISATANAESGYARAYGIAVGTLAGTLTNTGTIRASAVGSGALAAGVRIYDFNGGVLNNSGTISGRADGGEGQAYSLLSWGINATINNNAGGVLRGNLGVYNSWWGGGGNVVNNAGIIQIPVMAGGGGAGFGYIDGDYNQSASGFVALGAANASLYSRFYVNGTANMTGSNQVAIHATPNNTLAVGDTLDNVFTANAWVGLASGAAVTVLGTPLFTFSGIEDGGNNIDITVVSKNTFAGVLGGLGGIGGTLDGLAAGYTGSGPLDGLLNILYETNTQAELDGAVRQLLPLLTSGTTGVIANTLRGTNRIIQSRQESNQGMSSGDDFFGDRNFWLKPVGSWANQDNRNGTSGYDANTFGMVIGADGVISDTSRIGVAFSYMRSNVDSNAAAKQRATIDGYQAIVYGSYSLDANTELSMQADFGLNQNEGKRAIPLLGVTAKSDYDSWSTHIGAGLARTYELNEKTSFIPSVRADYTYIRDESYRESGAGNYSYKVKGNNTDELILAVDGKLSHAVADHVRMVANLGLGYDVINEQYSITTAFVGGGAAFTTKGIDPSPWLVRGGLGLVMTTGSAVEVTARYDFEARNDFDNQTGSIKVRVPF